MICQMCRCALNKQLICITNNRCLILHHKAFRADYISHVTKIRATQRCANSSTAQILIQVRYEIVATSHVMQVFNDLHYSNRCRFISIAWPVAMASLPLNTVQCHIVIYINNDNT
jgi:hypothetical protein